MFDYFVAMRNYKRKTDRKPCTPDMLQVAKKRLDLGISKRQIAKDLKISESALRNRLKKGFGVDKLGRFEKVFGKEQERELAEHCRELDECFYGLTFNSLRRLSYQFAEANTIKNPFHNVTKMAGKDWTYDFMKRFKLSLRVPQKTSLARIMGFNKVQVERFFDNLLVLMTRHEFPPTRIYNMDESGITTVPNKIPKVITKLGKKAVGKIVSAERGQLVTVVCAMSASGNYVPPAIIFPRKRRKEELINGAPPGSVMMCSDSGYMNSELFQEWMRHFQKHVMASKENPVLLILDNHTSHTSLDAVLYCRENNIHLLSIPPHSSHKLQPLDRCFFKPLKDFYAQACDQWLVNHPGRVITQFQMAELFGVAYEKCASIGKGTNGFKMCGIYPMDRYIFTDEDFLPSAVTDQLEYQASPSPALELSVNQPTTSAALPLSIDQPSSALELSVNQPMTSAALPLSIDQPSSALELSVNQPMTSAALPLSIDQPSSALELSVNQPMTSAAPPLSINQPSTTHELEFFLNTPTTSAVLPLTPSRVLRTNTTSVSPADIIPFPKRKEHQNRRKRGQQSQIISGSPFKMRLEDMEKTKKADADKGCLKKGNTKKALGINKENRKQNKIKTSKNKLEEKNNVCPGCEEKYFDPPAEDWIQCHRCRDWWHESCTSYECIGYFTCDYCNQL